MGFEKRWRCACTRIISCGAGFRDFEEIGKALVFAASSALECSCNQTNIYIYSYACIDPQNTRDVLTFEYNNEKRLLGDSLC